MSNRCPMSNRYPMSNRCPTSNHYPMSNHDVKYTRCSCPCRYSEVLFINVVSCAGDEIHPRSRALYSVLQ